MQVHVAYGLLSSVTSVCPVESLGRGMPCLDRVILSHPVFSLAAMLKPVVHAQPKRIESPASRPAIGSSYLSSFSGTLNHLVQFWHIGIWPATQARCHHMNCSSMSIGQAAVYVRSVLHGLVSDCGISYRYWRMLHRCTKSW